jgi:hypothetical protein
VPLRRTVDNVFRIQRRKDETQNATLTTLPTDQRNTSNGKIASERETIQRRRTATTAAETIVLWYQTEMDRRNVVGSRRTNRLHSSRMSSSTVFSSQCLLPSMTVTQMYLLLLASMSIAVSIGSRTPPTGIVMAMVPTHSASEHRRQSLILLQQAPPSWSDGDHDEDQAPKKSTTKVSSTTPSSSSSLERQELKSLQEQAEQLRREARELQLSLQQQKLEKARAEQEKIDRWIDDLLIEARFSGGSSGDGGTDAGVETTTSLPEISSSSSSQSMSSNTSLVSRSSTSSSSTSTTTTELLKTVDQVLERLRDDRYSAEQVNKIFRRLCELRPQEARSDLSPMMELLVDAAGKLDCTDRDENPNKRWNGRVERLLRKKLFARDWNIDLRDEDEIDAANPWKM